MLPPRTPDAVPPRAPPHPWTESKADRGDSSVVPLVLVRATIRAKKPGCKMECAFGKPGPGQRNTRMHLHPACYRILRSLFLGDVRLADTKPSVLDTRREQIF